MSVSECSDPLGLHTPRLRGQARRHRLAIGMALTAISIGCQPTDPHEDAATTLSHAVEETADSTPRVATNSPQPSTSSVAPAPPRSPNGDEAAEAVANDPSVATTPPNQAAETDGPQPPPTTTGDVVEILFEDIQLPIQQDMVFRPFMLTDRVRELDGKRIRIHGYMLPDAKTKGIRQFVLLKNTECKFGPGGQADHLINVLMVDGVTAKFREDAITVEGILKVNPFEGPDGNTWSIYDLACDRVETYRPRR